MFSKVLYLVIRTIFQHFSANSFQIYIGFN